MRSMSSPRAVSMMIGVCETARTLRHRLRPSSPGSMTSRMSRSTRRSVIARAISLPSPAVATLQSLVRRYLAISIRVSRSSSTTRMLGDGCTMPTFVDDSGRRAKDFCFKMFLTRRLQQGATCDKAPLRPRALRSRRLSRTFGANMTSISALSSTSYQSPLQKLQAELQSEVNSGAISSSDQTALSSALSDIDTSLQQSRAGDQSSGTKAAPGDLKAKIDDLIAGEVSSGKLTSDQATELQGVFKAAFGNGAGGSGGPGGAGGPPPGGPPPADSSSSADATDTSSGTSTIADILQQFLQSLQSSLSSSTSYGATGNASSDANSSFSALLIDYHT